MSGLPDAADRRKSSVRRLARLACSIGQGIERFEVASLCLGVGGLTLLLAVNVIARLFFKSLYYAEEISEFLVLWTTFAGVSYSVRRARHIRMGAIFDALPYPARKAMIFVIAFLSAAIMFIMAVLAFRYLLNSRLQGHMTPALRIPYWLFVAIVPVSFFSAGLQYIRTILKNIHERDVWLSPEQQGEYETEG